MMEEWRPAPGFPNYQVSSLGRVRRASRGKRTYVGRILKRYETAGGYNRPALYKDKKLYRVPANRLICEAFHGPPPSPHHEAAHGNGNPGDDSASNLRWATKSENAADRYLHGTQIFGDRHHNAKLSDGEVVEIKECLAKGVPRQTLADKYGVSKVHIGRIHTGAARKYSNIVTQEQDV